MTVELQKVKPIHSAVARELAMGISLGEICKYRNLNLDSWRVITQASLFKSEVERIRQQIENEAIDQHINDPVRARLQMKANDAVEVLGDELHNMDKETGGSAPSRISAANSILDRLGYGRRDKDEMPNITINISQDKASKLQELIPA